MIENTFVEILIIEDTPQDVDLALRALLKGDSHASLIPGVALASSKEQRDVVEGCPSGGNSSIVKPVIFKQFSDAVQRLGMDWLLLNHPPKLGA